MISFRRSFLLLLLLSAGMQIQREEDSGDVSFSFFLSSAQISPARESPTNVWLSSSTHAFTFPFLASDSRLFSPSVHIGDFFCTAVVKVSSSSPSVGVCVRK